MSLTLKFEIIYIGLCIQECVSTSHSIKEVVTFFCFNILGDIVDHVSSIYVLLVDRCLNYFNKYNFTSLSINLTIIHYINSEDKTQS